MCFLGSKIQQCYKTKISKIVNITSSAISKQWRLIKGIGCLQNLQPLLSLYLNDEIGYSTTVFKPVA